MKLKQFIHIPFFLFLTFFNHTESFSQDNQFHLINHPNTLENIINFSESNFLSAYVLIIDDETIRNSFLIHTRKNENYFINGENFVNSKIKNNQYSLVNFHLPFLTIKYNVLPYLYPDYAIKVLYLMDKLKFYPRISDAMRSNEEQIRYKRRGWSNVESSPHLIGIAMDLSYFTKSDRDIILKYVSNLGIHFLEHGGRGNHHIHLQDEEKWASLFGYDVNNLSDSLNKYVGENYNILKPYFLIEGNEISDDDFKFDFYSDKNEMIKIEIENLLEKKCAHISAGIFEPGTHTIYLHKDFLKKGTYIFKYYRNNLLFKEECLFFN